MGANSFFYFAYGSNLLSKRIHINNPSAKRKDIGKLENHKLDFITYSKSWHGASATIVPQSGEHVWGAIWELDNIHLQSLDEQEGVSDKIYFPKMESVIMPNGNTIKCRVYQQTVTPFPYNPSEGIPQDRMPSKVYHNVILQGAEESGLPSNYISKLKEIKHNGYAGAVDIGLDLHVML